MHKLILVNYVSLVVHSDAYKFCATTHDFNIEHIVEQGIVE